MSTQPITQNFNKIENGEKNPIKNVPHQDELIKNMSDMKERPEMKWNGSRAPEFQRWMEQKNAPEPKEANCWNAILLAAYHSGAVDKDYIELANIGGATDDGPVLATAISANPRGCLMKKEGKTIDFKNEITKLEIPKGDIITLGKQGIHVCLSLGENKIIELDKQPAQMVKNDNYNKDYGKSLQKLTQEIAALERKIIVYQTHKTEDNTLYNKTATQLINKKSELSEFAKNNSRDEYKIARPDNEISEKPLLSLDNYFDMKSLDGIYWGPLPNKDVLFSEISKRKLG